MDSNGMFGIQDWIFILDRENRRGNVEDKEKKKLGRRRRKKVAKISALRARTQIDELLIELFPREIRLNEE